MFNMHSINNFGYIVIERSYKIALEYQRLSGEFVITVVNQTYQEAIFLLF
jgi:hypothetical protein